MNSKLIIRIAVGVSAAAFLFSLVTLIRALVVRLPIAFPLIQFFGSAAIAAVCLVMLFKLRVDNEPEEEEKPRPDRARKVEVEPQEAGEAADAAEKAVDDLYEKYNLSDFE